MGEGKNCTEAPNLEIRMMKTKDASGVVELYKSVYGDKYPVKSVYDVEEIKKQLEIGESIRIVCCTSEGQVVGHLAAHNHTCISNPALYEESQGLILPQFRSRGIMTRLMTYADSEVYSRRLELAWGEAGTNHVLVQKNKLETGWHETGIEIDLMPTATYQKEQSSQGRVSTIYLFKIYKDKPQTVYLPEIYEDSLRYLYSVRDFGHTFLPARASLSSTPTHGLYQIFEGAKVARFSITELGSDFEKYLLQQEKEALGKDACILQVYLNLASPACAAAIDVLRRHRYFLGGVLPRWFETDGMFMQKTMNPPGFGNVQLYSERAQRILEIIESDYRAISK
ncbi:MAG: GNAT family N-acetyltransferase [Syntrophomonas sp.]